MAPIQFSLPWDTQPQELADVSSELSGAIVWTAPDRFGIHGARIVRSASEGSFNGLVAGQLGLSASWARSASAGVDFGLIQPLDFTPASGITIAVVAAPVSTAAVRSPISFRKGSGGLEQTEVVFNATAAIGAAAGYATMYTRNTAGAATAVSASAGGIDGGLHCWVFGNSDASGYIYLDGTALSLGTSTRPSGTLVSTSQKLRIGNIADYTADGAYVHSDPLLLVIAWPRLLPAAEAAEWSRRLARNIGEAFEPQSIHAYIAAAGGPTTFTITPSGSVVFSGTISQLHEKQYSPTGSVVFSGTAPVTDTNTYQITPSGEIVFAGTLAQLHEKIIAAGGMITFNGTGGVIYLPAGGVIGADYQRISIGLGRAGRLG